MVFYLCMIEFLILCTINNTIKFVLLILELSFGLNVAIRFVISIGRKSTTSDLLCYLALTRTLNLQNHNSLKIQNSKCGLILSELEWGCCTVILSKI